MNVNFGDELSLEEVEDVLGTASPFGEELTLFQCLEILRETAKSPLPPRAQWFENHMDEIQDALHKKATRTNIDNMEFKIEYFARIRPIERFDFAKPLAWIKIGANGSDPQSGNQNTNTSRCRSESDV